MDLNKLKTFYTLAQTKNYTRCAEKTFVTQSAVSHAIRGLEESLDLVLVNKKKSSFSLTKEGEILFQSCRSIFSELEKTKYKLQKECEYPEPIKLGVPIEFGVSIILKSMNTFFEKYPKYHVDYMLSHSLLQPLLDDELDLIIDCHPHANRELKIIPLLREEYAVIAAPKYLQLNHINKPSDLKSCNILSIDKEVRWWDNFLNALTGDQQVSFNKVTEINHVRGIITAALSSMGVGFVPKYTILKELEQGNLVALFPDLKLLNDQINIYVKHKNSSNDGISNLVEYLHKFTLH